MRQSRCEIYNAEKICSKNSVWNRLITDEFNVLVWIEWVFNRFGFFLDWNVNIFPYFGFIIFVFIQTRVYGCYFFFLWFFRVKKCLLFFSFFSYFIIQWRLRLVFTKRFAWPMTSIQSRSIKKSEWCIELYIQYVWILWKETTEYVKHSNHFGVLINYQKYWLDYWMTLRSLCHTFFLQNI